MAGVRDSKVLSTQREAKAWAPARETELRTRKDAEPAETHTIAEMLRRYLREVSSTKLGARPEGLHIEASLRDASALDSPTSADIKTPEIVAWRDARLSGYTGPDGVRNQPALTASVLRDIKWLRSAFSTARKEWH